jgi:hypothetical protein
MTTTNIPTAEELEQIDPEKNSVVSREDDEGVSIEAYIVRGDGIRETSARTYTRSFGHYFLESDSECSDILDEIIADYTSDNGILSSFDRKRFDGYEIIIEINDILSESDDFSEKNKAEINLNSKSKHIDKIDTLLSKIDAEI